MRRKKEKKKIGKKFVGTTKEYKGIKRRRRRGTALNEKRYSKMDQLKISGRSLKE